MGPAPGTCHIQDFDRADRVYGDGRQLEHTAVREEEPSGTEHLRDVAARQLRFYRSNLVGDGPRALCVALGQLGLRQVRPDLHCGGAE